MYKMSNRVKALTCFSVCLKTIILEEMEWEGGEEEKKEKKKRKKAMFLNFFSQYSGKLTY